MCWTLQKHRKSKHLYLLTNISNFKIWRHVECYMFKLSNERACKMMYALMTTTFSGVELDNTANDDNDDEIFSHLSRDELYCL